jgi:hypothetical protein
MHACIVCMCVYINIRYRMYIQYILVVLLLGMQFLLNNRTDNQNGLLLVLRI